MGLVSEALIAGAAATGVLSLTSRDRTVAAMTALVAANLMLSLLVHWTIKGVGRSTPLMLMDSVELYVMCLTAVCRLDRPLWLYSLCAVTGLECVAHLAYVAAWLPSNGHTLALNVLFLLQLASLVAGRWSGPEDEALARRPTAIPFAGAPPRA